jgi:GNAT superfamily N-acetyltransferase
MEPTTVDMHDDEQAEDFFAVYQEAHVADTPDEPAWLRDEFVALGRQESAEARTAFEAVYADNEMVGAGMVVMPTIDNAHLADVKIWVRPQHRRRGAGQALLAQLTRHARDGERTTLFAQALGPVPGGPPRDAAGARFLEAAGFTAVLSMVSRRVDLTGVDAAAEQALLEQCLPYATGYDTVTWDGTTPDPLAAGVAAVTNRTSTDAPRGGMDIEQATLDARRLHAAEREWLEAGSRLVGAAAVHRRTGEVAAVTSIGVRPSGDHGRIRTTIAHPAHRGNRLGTIVKIEAHRQVRRLFPQLRYVSTSNADANDHMVAINDKLGYVAYQTGTNYQHRLD